jgi:hypothetical protein
MKRKSNIKLNKNDEAAVKAEEKPKKKIESKQIKK